MPTSNIGTKPRSSSPSYRDTLANRYRIQHDTKLNDDSVPVQTPGKKRVPIVDAGAARSKSPTASTPRPNSNPDASGDSPRSSPPAPIIRDKAADRYLVPGRPLPTPTTPTQLDKGPTAPEVPGISPPGLVAVDPNKPLPRPDLRRRTDRDVKTGGGLIGGGSIKGPDLGPRRRGPRHFTGGSTRYFYGSNHWNSHYSTLRFCFGGGPSWCNWGLYSYPFYYGCHWPRWYFYNRMSFCVYWNSHASWQTTCWWWPRNYYMPSVWYVDYDDYAPYYGASYYSSPPYIERASIPGGSDAAAAKRGSEELLVERHISLGDFYFKENRFDEAAESYLRALTYAPEDASLHFILADALFASGDYHYAAFILTKAVKIDPEIVLAKADKREFYSDVKLFYEQMGTLRTYIAEHPYDHAANLVLGYNLKFSGYPEGARKAFLKVLEIDEGNATAQAFLDALRDS